MESGDKGRGYQIGKDEYMPVEDEELDSLALESPAPLSAPPSQYELPTTHARHNSVKTERPELA